MARRLPKRHERLREHVVAVGPDELLQFEPRRVVGDDLQGREADVAAVGEPESHQRSADVFQQSINSSSETPSSAGGDQTPDDRAIAGLEQPVELGDAPWPAGWLSLHLLNGGHQLARLAEQPQPRKANQQFAQSVLEGPRRHDPPR